VEKNFASAIPLRARSQPRRGEPIVVLGFPTRGGGQGSILTLTQGVVSALAGLGNEPNDFQFTAPIQGGNSGGPIIDKYGQVIGVVTSTIDPRYFTETTGGFQPQNINFGAKLPPLKDLLGYARAPAQETDRTTPMNPEEIDQRYSGLIRPVLCY